MTKHEQASDALRRMIRDGKYAPGQRLPSETELPALLGVGKNTVVHALNDLAREGVIVRRRRSGSYVADPGRRPLVPGRDVRIGVLLPHALVPDFHHGPMQRDIIIGALRKWEMDAVAPLFAQAGRDEVTRATWTDPQRQCTVEVIGEDMNMAIHPYHPPLEAVRAGRFDGIVTLGIVEHDWLAELLGLGVPVVLADYSDERFGARADRVFFDPFSGYRATVHAMIARNLRRIHFVGCWMHLPHTDPGVARLRAPASYDPSHARPDPESLLRKAAWRQAMDEAGLPCPNEWSHFTWSNGEPVRTFAAQLASLPEGERPEALVCHGIGQAEACIEVFRSRGLPLQAAGVTSGQHRHTAWPIYADPFRMGDLAAELLLRRIQNPAATYIPMGVTMTLPEFMVAST